MSGPSEQVSPNSRKATNKNTPVSYDMETIAVLLQLYGIAMPPNYANDESGEVDVAFYPYANVFPVNSFLEDALRYILARKTAVRNRRIGFLMQDDQTQWFILILNIEDVQTDLLHSVCDSLSDKNLSNPEEIKALLGDSNLVEKIRHLYGSVQPLILGIEPDKALMEKIGQLLTRAYALEMTLKAIPPENEQYRDVHLVQDAFTLLVSGKLQREIASYDLFSAQQKAARQALRLAEDRLALMQKSLYTLKEYGIAHFNC